MEIYIATENADRTEGRGPMKEIGYYTNEEAAIAAVRGRGVMGAGDGEVIKVQVHDEFQVDPHHPRRGLAQFYPIRIWGYRQGWDGKWGYGYIDNRDAPVNDPEYQTYVRLKKKFGGA